MAVDKFSLPPIPADELDPDEGFPFAVEWEGKLHVRPTIAGIKKVYEDAKPHAMLMQFDESESYTEFIGKALLEHLGAAHAA